MRFLGRGTLLFLITIKVRYEGKTLAEDMLFQKVVEQILVYSKNRDNVNLVRQFEDYSYDKFIWDVTEISAPEVIELGGKKVEIFKKGEHKLLKSTPHKGSLKEIGQQDPFWMVTPSVGFFVITWRVNIELMD